MVVDVNRKKLEPKCIVYYATYCQPASQTKVGR